MRVVFMGTPDFAVATLDALADSDHEVVAVVAQPDRPKGRGKKLQSPPTIDRARELGLPTRQPRAIKKGPFFEWFTGLDIDAAVVVAFGRILTLPYLQTPRHGCINVHASLLPRYRGAAPIQWSVINGETVTGCCTMQLEEGLDTGPVYLRRETPIGAEETAGELFGRLAPLGAELLIETLDRIDQLEPQPQDHAAATHAPPLKKSDGRIDWTWPAQRIHDLVRGTNPWPGAHCTLRGEPFKVHRTRLVDGEGPAGTFLHGPVIAAGQGALELVEVQLPGKKRQPGEVFINGARIEPGEQLS